VPRFVKAGPTDQSRAASTGLRRYWEPSNSEALQRRWGPDVRRAAHVRVLWRWGTTRTGYRRRGEWWV